MPDVILVNEVDEEMGAMEKLEAHRKGLLHRAFSIFIFDSTGKMLLQQRALLKYHNGGVWSNTCCSHPSPGETTEAAASRRLQEEMGFTVSLDRLFTFTYKIAFDNGLMENEFDHVFTGSYDGQVNINQQEVMNYSFRGMDQIRHEIKHSPQKFTEWFRLSFPRIDDYWHSVFNS